MSKILLIEPSKMLQHAFVLALFPEHEVEIISNIGDAAKGTPDLAIIDAATLRDAAIAAPGAKLNRNLRLPMIRIGGDAGADSNTAEVAVLSIPFTKEELRAAITQALNSAPSNTAVRTEEAPLESTSPRKAKAAKGAAKKQDAEDRQVIELVDVFEDEDLDESARS